MHIVSFATGSAGSKPRSALQVSDDPCGSSRQLESPPLHCKQSTCASTPWSRKTNRHHHQTRRQGGYTFHHWKLELDHEQVLQRLIHDVYGDPVVFVRELIQNALDATRSEMYADFATQNPGATLQIAQPNFPLTSASGIPSRCLSHGKCENFT